MGGVAGDYFFEACLASSYKNVTLLVYMSTMQNAPRGTEPPPKPTKRQTAILLATIADTTWRMFVPILGLLALGLWCDKQVFASTPWLTVGGLLLGILLATALVRQQLKRVNS